MEYRWVRIFYVGKGNIIQCRWDRSDMDTHTPTQTHHTYTYICMYILLLKGTEERSADSIYMVLVINHDRIMFQNDFNVFIFKSSPMYLNGGMAAVRDTRLHNQYAISRRQSLFFFMNIFFRSSSRFVLFVLYIIIPLKPVRFYRPQRTVVTNNIIIDTASSL